MLTQPTTSKTLRQWVDSIASHARPSQIHWCDGTPTERELLQERAIRENLLIPLDPSTHPRSFLHRSPPVDATKMEKLTFVVTADEEDVGPTNKWMSSADADRRVWPLFAGAMEGRTMYVVPYLMGPAGSRYTRVGVELTDSPFVALCLRVMVRVGSAALDRLGSSANFVRGLHSMGDLSPDRQFLVHFPEALEIWSIGSGQGASAVLSKESHALRIASVQARQEGWLAEHMAILGVTNPVGDTTTSQPHSQAGVARRRWRC